jgi:transposase
VTVHEAARPAVGNITFGTPSGHTIAGITLDQAIDLLRVLVILSPSRGARVFAYPAPVVLRRGYNGLYGLVEQGLHQAPLNGDVFLFVNASRKLCKVLLWNGTGLCIFQKRLDRGTFAELWRDDDQCVRLTLTELALFIEGCKILEWSSLSPVPTRNALVSDRGV